MANLSDFKFTPRAALAECNEFNFRGLYLYHTYSGPKPNQSIIVYANATGLGQTCVNNWDVYDGLGPNAKVVARAQGLHLYAGTWHNSFSLVFEHERLKGSTLQVMGVPVTDGEWAIVGGTGEFSMANGVIYKKIHQSNGNGNIVELTVHGFVPAVKGSRMHVTKIGPWGGHGGSAKDITEAPMRLESITLRSGVVIDSIAFSYVDQAGEKRTGGPWGGPGGNPKTIQLASSECVREVSGTYGTFDGVTTLITSMKVITNINTYGPYGQEKGTHFSIPVQSGSSIVGFYGRSGKYLDQIGVYTHPL